MWKLNSVLVNSRWVQEGVTRGVKTLKMFQKEDTTHPNHGMQLKLCSEGKL